MERERDYGGYSHGFWFSLVMIWYCIQVLSLVSQQWSVVRQWWSFRGMSFSEAHFIEFVDNRKSQEVETNQAEWGWCHIGLVSAAAGTLDVLPLPSEISKFTSRLPSSHKSNSPLTLVVGKQSDQVNIMTTINIMRRGGCWWRHNSKRMVVLSWFMRHDRVAIAVKHQKMTKMGHLNVTFSSSGGEFLLPLLTLSSDVSIVAKWWKLRTQSYLAGMVHTLAKGGSLLPAAGTLTEEWCYGLGIDCYRYEEAGLWWMACMVVPHGRFMRIWFPSKS